jgi:RimJ/RimL family protein N-acetyltransferase
MLPAVIHTPRLLLRVPRLDDVGPIYRAYDHDPEVLRYLTWRPNNDISETESFIAGCIDAWQAGSRFPWVITTTPGDEPVGMIEARIDKPRAELGYVLARSAWGRGYMTEAVQAVVEVLLALPELYRVWACCDVDNAASARVLEKSGLGWEATLRRYAIHPNLSTEPRDVNLYARTR